MISYCGENAHFQTGKAEKRIKDPQEQTIKQLHHAKVRWPSTVELALCYYALRQVIYTHNFLPEKEDSTSPLESFSYITVTPKLRGNH